MTAHFVNLLDQLRRRSLRMASMVEDMVEESCEAITEETGHLGERVLRRDKEVDAEEVNVEAEVIRLMALYQPVGSDLRLLCTVLKVNNDLERIADCAVNIAERARHLDPKLLPETHDGVLAMKPIVQHMLRNAISAYGSEDEETARKVLSEDPAVDAHYCHVIQNVVSDAAAEADRLASQLDMLSVAKNLERIADHSTNIAEDVIFLVTGQIIRHTGEGINQA